MISLPDILKIFRKGYKPKEEEFRETWRSFWHKSERLPLNQVLGLNDSLNKLEDLKAEKVFLEQTNAKVNQLEETKASKDELASVAVGGLNPMGDVDLFDELANKPKRHNDSYFVKDRLNENGDPYIFRYDSGLDDWINTKQVVYQDVARKGGINKTLKEVDDGVRIVSRQTDVKEKDNLAIIRQDKSNGQYNPIQIIRESDNLVMGFGTGTVLKYHLAKDGDSSKPISVKAGEIFSLTACGAATLPLVIGFSSAISDERKAGNLVSPDIGYSLLISQQGEIQNDTFLVKNFDFIIPDGIEQIVVQGRNEAHEGFVNGYKLTLEKKEADNIKDVNIDVFTTKAESYGFWNDLLTFIQGTIGLLGVFEETDNRIVSKFYNKRTQDTFSARVALGYEFTIICFDENRKRLGFTGSAWSRERIDESFLPNTDTWRAIIRKTDGSAISPLDPHNFESVNLQNKVWDRLVSERSLNEYLSEYSKDEKLNLSEKILAPDSYVDAEITSEFLYGLYDSLLGNYQGIAPDDTVNKDNYYRVTKKSVGKDHSDTYDIYAYEFSPLEYTRTVFFTCLLHGTEVITSIGMYELLKHMVDNDTDSPVLKYMRDNVRVVLLPVANPWGLNNKKYGNINGVNPNRNYPYYWDEYVSEPTIWDKKGTAAFSEKETQIIRDIAVSLSGELDFVIDYHTGEGWRKEPFYYYDNTDDYVRPALIKAGQIIHADFYAEKGFIPTPETIETARDLKVFWFNRCLRVPCGTIEFSPALYSDVANDSTQLTWLMWNYLRYWTELFSLPKYTNKDNLGIERLTESEYKSIPAKSYKKIYILTDKGNVKKIGDIDF